MNGTRRQLSQLDSHLNESMGVRSAGETVRLVPITPAKEFGRSAIRNVARIDITQVVPDSQQPRTQFEEDSLQRLAASIRDKGQLSPIRVRWSDVIGKWLIISGERRWRACKLAGQETIDCCIHEGEHRTSHVLEEQLVENLLREELNPIEEAQAFQTLMTINGWTGKQLAAALAIPESKVTRTSALLKLPQDVQARVASGELAARSAYEISRLPQGTVRNSLLKRAATEGVSLRDAQRSRNTKRKDSPLKPQLTFFVDGGWSVVVSGQQRGCYEEVEQALLTALDEVRHRIQNRVRWT